MPYDGDMAMDRHELERLNKLAAHVKRLEDELTFLYRHLGITRPTPSPLDEVAQMIARGDMIAAIAKYREQTGASLADAKAAVDELAAKLGYA